MWWSPWELHLQAIVMVLVAWSAALYKHFVEPNLEFEAVPAKYWVFIMVAGCSAAGFWLCSVTKRMSELSNSRSIGTQTPTQLLTGNFEADELRKALNELEERHTKQREQLYKKQQELYAQRLDAESLRTRHLEEERARISAEKMAEDLQAQLDLVESRVGCGPMFPVAHLSPSGAQGVTAPRASSIEGLKQMVAATVKWADSAAGDLEQLQQQVVDLMALAEKEGHEARKAKKEAERLQEEKDRETTARRKAEEELAATKAELSRLKLRSREAEEMAATTSEVADALKDRLVELTTQASQDAVTLHSLQQRLDRLTAARLHEVTVSSQVEEMEREVRATLSSSLEMLAKRRTELEVQNAVRRSAEADERGVPLCKICYEKEIECALLPCKHHSFCKRCATHIVRTSRKCPFCRKEAVDLFETFLG